jgi:hypothetical protein
MIALLAVAPPVAIAWAILSKHREAGKHLVDTDKVQQDLKLLVTYGVWGIIMAFLAGFEIGHNLIRR